MNINDSIEYNVNEGIARACINRPEAYNSVNRDVALGLQEAMHLAAEDPAVRVVCISGKGTAFCAGQDLKEAGDPANLDIGAIVREHYNPLVTAIRQLEKPVVAAVNGVAAGAGASIALACDITIAAESASFIEAFSKIALIPDSAGTYFLPRLVGMQKAAALTFLAEPLSAKDAASLNLISKVFPDDVFEQEVDNLLHKMAVMPTKALGLTKRLLNASWDNNLKQQLEMEAVCQAEAAQSADFIEGVLAFKEKRRADFKGL